MHDGTRRAIVAAFLANLGIAAAKFVAFAATGSASMLAESIHSVADTGNQGLLFLGGRRSRRAPTAAHPFGFGQERYFWAFVVALVLFSLGSLFALAEGVDKLRNPEHLDSPLVAYAVLGVAIVLESLSLRTARREALPMREGRSWWTFIHNTKNAEIPVVLLAHSSDSRSRSSASRSPRSPTSRAGTQPGASASGRCSASSRWCSRSR